MIFSLKRVSKGILRLALMVVLCACPESRILCQESSTGPVFLAGFGPWHGGPRFGPPLLFMEKCWDARRSRGFRWPVLCNSIGLVDHMDVTARVFLLGEGDKQSRIKMMSFPKAKAAKSDQRFIHSTLGFSYLTLHVMNLDASMKRLKAAKIPFEGETPVALEAQQCIACGSGSR